MSDFCLRHECRGTAGIAMPPAPFDPSEIFDGMELGDDFDDDDDEE